MFRIVSAIILALSILIVLVHLLFCRSKNTSEINRTEQKPVPKIISVIRWLSYTFGLISFLILLISGFAPRIIFDKMIHGYWLMVHVTLGGVFAVCVAASAILWSEENRMDKRYCKLIQKLLGRQVDPNTPCEPFEFVRKITFWLVLLLAAIVMTSILLSMFELFGTEVQILLLNIHRYCAILLSAIVLYHTSLTICACKRK